MISSKVTLCFGVLLALTVLGGGMNHYYQSSLRWQIKLRGAEKVVRQQTEAIERLQLRQQEVAAIDTRLTEELRHEENENTLLRHQLATGARRLRIAGRCPPVHAGTTTGNLGNGASVDVSGDTGQDILTLRQNIIRDRKKLIYLQEYIMATCKR
ncbi:Bacteriophage lysis protein [compost metagenome]|uniref:Lysis protein n=1 Tax=Serratia liquefaciens TaxID=614 RepID=A0ABX7DDE8_SERLI|nr:lysis protein [Serratia liquefaciens]QQU58038.1 lysis protein [Serratia liquefaciens]